MSLEPNQRPKKATDDLHKEEIVAKSASSSLQVLDMIMQAMKDSKGPLFCPDYQSFLRLINDPKNAAIKDILESTKSEILKNEVGRLELRKEIMKQRDSLKF